MERYISASKLRWRKYGDRGEPADRYGHKGRRTVRGRFMDEAASSQSITPAALPLHYGDTMHTHRLFGIYHIYCQTDSEVETAGLGLDSGSTVLLSHAGGLLVHNFGPHSNISTTTGLA